MEKMILLPMDRYQSLTVGKQDTPKSLLNSSKTEADDVKVAKFQEAFVKKETKRKNAQSTDLDGYIKKMKPILEGSAREWETLIASFPSEQHERVRAILNILSHLPKVEVTSQEVKIEGKPMNESSTVIVKEMLDNKIEDAASVIAHLRGYKKNKEENTLQGETIPSPAKGLDSLSSYESFSDSLIPYLAAQSTPERPSRSLEKVVTPKTATPRQRAVSTTSVKRRESSPSPYNKRLRTRGKKNVSRNRVRWENY